MRTIVNVSRMRRPTFLRTLAVWPTMHLLVTADPPAAIQVFISDKYIRYRLF